MRIKRLMPSRCRLILKLLNFNHVHHTLVRCLLFTAFFFAKKNYAEPAVAYVIYVSIVTTWQTQWLSERIQ